MAVCGTVNKGRNTDKEERDTCHSDASPDLEPLGGNRNGEALSFVVCGALQVQKTKA